MEHCGETSVDYRCHPIKWTSFYEHYRRPFGNDQLIGRESYPPQQAPAVAHQRHGSLYHQHHHHYHHHLQQQQQQGRGGRVDVANYDDVTESRCVTSFIELQPASRAPARSVVVQSLGGSTEWSSTSPPFTHSHHCKYLHVTLSLHYCTMRPLYSCLLYTSPSPRDGLLSRMPSSA